MIWVLRHGDAEETSDEGDFGRELTEKGRRQAADAGRALAALGASVETCLTSPRVRAEQTAALACEALGLQPEQAEDLSEGVPDVAGLAAGRGEVLLVGHEPGLSSAIAQLTGGSVRLRKGGVAGIESGQLQLLLDPAALSGIAQG